jgi:hypothetical protein
MPQANLVVLAESCSAVRASIGRMLLTSEDSPARDAATDKYRRSLKALLRAAREEEYGLYLEVAGELAPRK